MRLDETLVAGASRLGILNICPGTIDVCFCAEFKRLRSLQNAKKTFAASRSVLRFRVLDLLECIPQRTGGEHLIVHILGTHTPSCVSL
jgi:hypothetical protein